MGINDIFEPARADFTPMTEDALIYAKHIEQSININIRTQSLQQLKSKFSSALLPDTTWLYTYHY